MAGWSHSHQGEVAARSSRTAGGTLQAENRQCFDKLPQKNNEHSRVIQSGFSVNHWLETSW